MPGSGDRPPLRVYCAGQDPSWRVQVVVDGWIPRFWDQVRREYLNNDSEPPDVLELVRIVLYWPGDGVVDSDGFHIIDPPGTRRTIPSLITLAKVYDNRNAVHWLEGRGVRLRDNGDAVVIASDRPGREQRLVYAIAGELFDYMLPLYRAAWRDASSVPGPLLEQVRAIMWPYYPAPRTSRLRSAIERTLEA